MGVQLNPHLDAHAKELEVLGIACRKYGVVLVFSAVSLELECAHGDAGIPGDIMTRRGPRGSPQSEEVVRCARLREGQCGCEREAWSSLAC
jgi:hypothetical protein